VIAGGAALDPIVAARILELFQHALAREAGAAREEFFAREIEILCQLAAGENNRQIAGRLALSEQTVKNLLSGLYEKLNVNNRTEAVIVALRRGLIKPQG
jgi:DNA-binding NarL/FixJ family response regulator